MTSLDKYQMVDGWQDSKKRHKKQKKRSKKKGRAVSSSDEVNHPFITQAAVVICWIGTDEYRNIFTLESEVIFIASFIAGITSIACCK